MKIISLLFLGLAFTIFFTSCGSGQLTVDEAYSVLRPVKQLELPDQVSENLVVSIANVADEGSSFKNHLDLYVNDKLIKPNWAVSNVENKYTYKLRLRPGYYEVKAYYYALVGWGEEKFPISTKEPVRITADQRTLLSCDITKEAGGIPVNRKMIFKMTTEPFEAAAQTPAQPAVQNTAPVVPDKPVEIAQPALQVTIKPPDPTPVVERSIALQIKTVPENAEVILDDKFVGQSPLTLLVTREVDHVVQIAAPGYRNAVKYLDHSLFGEEQALHLYQTLEPIQ
jgi:hypothetical protein